MGTMLYTRGVFVNACYDELNVLQPNLVRDVHAEYLRAGADIIETNTFGANPVKLSAHGFEDRTEEINAAAARVAREAVEGMSGRDEASVLGAIGPLGIRIEPWGPTAADEAEAFFARQVAGLVDGGVDGFVLETFGDVDELAAALRAVRALSDQPVFAQVTVAEDGNTAYGTSIEAAAAALEALGPDVIGVNCAVGPAAMLDTIERLAALTDRPISALPNAGFPRAVGHRVFYLAEPEYMGRYARRLIEAGARFVGGCCGTTPDHIRQIAAHVAAMQPAQTAAPAARRPVTVKAPLVAREPIALAERSAFGYKLAGGKFLQTVEITPPRGWDAADMISDCRDLKRVGIDAAHVLDSPRAQSRMGVLAAALLIERETGLETVFHYTCRDRNMLSLQSSLLGAAAAGLRNALLVTGDPPVIGAYPDSSAVFDIDSIGLTNLVARLNHGLDPGGNSIGEPTPFVIGIAVTQAAGDREREISRFGWKVEAGAEFVVTQPVFDPDALAGFFDAAADAGIPGLPVIAGIRPFASLREAEFYAHEVPDARVPDRLVERMRSAQESGADAARAEGFAIAAETFEAIRSVVRGVQLATTGPLVSVLELQAALGLD